ncbi:undecaprenyldiphospho-muramoylpentapeptide beta-N-acetylglucosaminyltransferase [Faunimonas sp. B44]|uniref:undecaprenyldiphospho-muramoylpentapeptide beta-N-acetylglucosaminyltransferase n=1 Tax=Faunimonas sp. B44 TaxID=3461493 RepID=UPI0040448A03
MSDAYGATALLVAGGTGGHLFPALALREALLARGWRVRLATDPRVGDFVEGVPPEERHVVHAAALSGGSPAAILRSMATMGRGLLQSRRLMRAVSPRIVVGFGGYPTVPPLIAARLARIPILVHEQNAVLGRANRLLVRFGAHLATGFDHPKGGEAARAQTFVGNPVRAAIAAMAERRFRAPGEDEPFNLLVFGGSQGARVFADVVPAALGELGEAERRRIAVVQQCRPEDIVRTRASYAQLGIAAELEPFFRDMPRRLADAHLVVSRAGASTVTEIAVVGRPAMLVPYPHALDHDQAANAAALAAAGGAWLVPETEFTPGAFAKRLAALIEAPGELESAARAAAGQGRPDAAECLADLVAGIASGGHGVDAG